MALREGKRLSVIHWVASVALTGMDLDEGGGVGGLAAGMRKRGDPDGAVASENEFVVALSIWTDCVADN